MSLHPLPLHLWAAALGGVFGAVLHFTGFSDFTEVQRMFRLEDLRLLFTFAGAVGLLGVGFALLKVDRRGGSQFHPGILPGSLLFGAGWALTGACPSVALVQVGEGKLPALVTVTGIWVGTWAYGHVHRRWLRWDRGGCSP